MGTLLFLPVGTPTDRMLSWMHRGDGMPWTCAIIAKAREDGLNVAKALAQRVVNEMADMPALLNQMHLNVIEIDSIDWDLIVQTMEYEQNVNENLQGV